LRFVCALENLAFKFDCLPIAFFSRKVFMLEKSDDFDSFKPDICPVLVVLLVILYAESFILGAVYLVSQTDS